MVFIPAVLPFVGGLTAAIVIVFVVKIHQKSSLVS